MSATPFGMIPVPLQDAMKATADNGGVPCGCRWNLNYTGVFLCSYHHGMFDGFNLAQEAAKTDPAHTGEPGGLNDYNEDRT